MRVFQPRKGEWVEARVLSVCEDWPWMHNLRYPDGSRFTEELADYEYEILPEPAMSVNLCRRLR